MKSKLRWSKASGSTRRRVEKLIARGWHPGARGLLGSRRRKRSTTLGGDD